MSIRVSYVFVGVMLISVGGCTQRQDLLESSTDIVWGEPHNGVVCGIRVATLTPVRLNVFIKNVGSEQVRFTISRKHYSTWADIYLNGEHYYPAPDTPAANHAVSPEQICVLSGETKKLPWCSFPCELGTYEVALKYWLNRSPMVNEAPSPPFFESATITINVGAETEQ